MRSSRAPRGQAPVTLVESSQKKTTKNDKKIAQLEILVDELIKDAPLESRVRTCMEAVGLKYTQDPIARMNTVLAELGGVRGPRKREQTDREL